MSEYQPAKLYELKPLPITAFQWLPTNRDFKFPRWFSTMVELGRAYTVQSAKESFVALSNKRGQYKGLPGDWICKDGFGHIFVVSQKTFHQRYHTTKKGLSQ